MSGNGTAGAAAVLGVLSPSVFAQQPTAEPVGQSRELVSPGPEQAVPERMAGSWDQEIVNTRRGG